MKGPVGGLVVSVVAQGSLMAGLGWAAVMRLNRGRKRIFRDLRATLVLRLVVLLGVFVVVDGDGWAVVELEDLAMEQMQWLLLLTMKTEW